MEDGDLDEICVDDNINCLDIDENDFPDIAWSFVYNDILVPVVEVNQIQTNPIIINVPTASSFKNEKSTSNLKPIQSTPVIPVTKNTRQSATQNTKTISFF